MTTKRHAPDATGLSPAALALRDELQSGTMRQHLSLPVADAHLDILQGADSLWLRLRRDGSGGFALRTAYSPGRPLQVETRGGDTQTARFLVSTSSGEFDVQITLPSAEKPLLHWTVTLTPAADLRLPFWPRDLYPLDAHGDPVAAEGLVHAAQRGLNSGLLYLTLARPRFGTALYFQDLTALNPYFEATGTIPDGRVGGEWPELGYALPTGGTPLPKGRPVVLSDAFLHWSDAVPEDPRQSARLFLDLLAGVYARLDRPAPLYHDWPRRAEQTLRDLARTPEVTVKHDGHLYLRPYVDAEYPDSMVQLTTLLPLREYELWTGKKTGLADDLRAGVPRFFDPELGTVRRYLLSVGKDKDPDEVDSWYLYHPLANLARLATEHGDAEAQDLFLRSLDYGIKVARHFHYQWPVQFNVRTLDIITGPRKPGEPGQSDTGGLYAYLMLQAHALTGEGRYLSEADKALRAVKDLEFQLGYQANITAWGAGACLRMWKATGDNYFREESFVFLATFFHNCLIWESEIKAARHYPIFLGVTCLHDGPYMALYECFEAFASFHEYLRWAEDDLPNSVRLLLTEYCKYAQSRAWFYYPSELPAAALAIDIRNGHIDCALSFPLEDLYADGQPAGQVGQEVYGCGAAFAFTTRSFHRLPDAPFVLFCEYPIHSIEASDEPCVSFRVRGLGDFACRARLIPTGHAPLPPVTVSVAHGIEVAAYRTDEGHWEFLVPGGGFVEVRWEEKQKGKRTHATPE